MRSFILELPRHYQRSPQDAALQKALEDTLARAEEDVDLTLAQMFPSTASGWGLEMWESAFGLARDAGLSGEERRARILAKVQGTGTTTLEKIRAIAQAFSSCPVEIEEISGEYRFVIWYNGTTGPVAQLRDLTAAINEAKPAHLDWQVRYS